MAQVSVYNQEGKEMASIQLTDAVFGIPMNETVVHQVYVTEQSNARLPWAHTKDRGEVRGGGKKPWRQKGTGRARHGSIRSPIWKGGGITFGPRSERNYTRKINEKMRQSAVAMCLSEKVSGKQLIVIDSLPATGKTKDMHAVRRALPGYTKTTLFVVDAIDDMVVRAVGNMQEVAVERAQDLNVVDLMHHQYVITTKEAINTLEKRFAK